MPRPLVARIDLAAIRHNYRYAKQLAPASRAVAVIKANAYGHGAVAVARTLAAEADAFGVACAEEAMELRESGIDNPILLMEGVFEPAELALAERHRLTPVVHSPEQLLWLLQARPGRPLSCWLKMDTGMHRVGLAPRAFQEAYRCLRACPHVADIVLMSHLARADELAHPGTTDQLAVFDAHVRDMDSPQSLANSAAIMGWTAARRQWLRPGIMLYGATPLPADHPASAPLRRGMCLESALIAIRELDAGAAVGYGGRFVCSTPTRVGVVSIGYADGYPRHARDGTPVAVKGRRTRIIGRVSMDMLTVDLTPVPDARVGDPVQLWGDRVDPNEVAAASDTIAYQLFAGLSRRVRLIHQDADADADAS
ncbi:alanine racemase [Thiohalocapsa marina]|uniref:Alanine racemase n=1 Tax=Thiohalocapsa marina TaxID=424902 RepID=A0A5M8FKN8_9GAMM|nr:alanine racemase [Thiohalocapsa marina]KAA6185054.1 alanine racemase [Thiohalocapsa marina]